MISALLEHATDSAECQRDARCGRYGGANVGLMGISDYRRKVNLLLIPNAHHVIAQQFLLVRLLIEECARNIARVDYA